MMLRPRRAAVYRGFSTFVAPSGTHHVDGTGQPLYTTRYAHVLPFHPPGLAPVQLTGSGLWTHIKPDGEPAYAARWKRAFGFYEGLSTVIAADVKDEAAWQHITPDGAPAYRSRWSWAGNFQSGRCTVRTDRREYQHINHQGLVIAGGPYAYAGDYREGYAVVRSLADGLCRHVDLEGRRLLGDGARGGFIDLDVFHKGWARARDERGWFFIDRVGTDVCRGRRFADLEPAYNGQALARTLAGARVVVNEDMEELVQMPSPEGENEARLQQLSTGYWPAFALRLGLEAGLPERVEAGNVTFPEGLRDGVDASHDQVVTIAEAWRELGLLRLKKNALSSAATGPPGQTYELTSMGRLLLPGTPDQQKACYWLQPRYLRAWMPEAPDANRGQPAAGRDTFAEVGRDRDALQQSHEVLALHAVSDWEGIERVILPAMQEVEALSRPLHVVDVGGGAGILLRQLAGVQGPASALLEGARLTCFDRPEVAELSRRTATDATVEFLGGDMFQPGAIPVGADVYILSRVLHDWPDATALQLLRRVREAAQARGSRLLVIDRAASSANAHAMLSLHMDLLQGARERWRSEWDALFREGGWKRSGGTKSATEHNGHIVFHLVPR